MHWLLDHLAELPAWSIVTCLALLAMLENSIFLGMFIPGETALLFGGALAYYDKVPLVAMAIVGAAGAVIGDSIGWLVGRTWGERIMRTRLARWLARGDRWERARAHLYERGFATVMLGRFGPGVRSLLPMLSGAAHMPFRRFFIANLIGGSVWAVGVILLGWSLGAAWERAHWIVGAVGVVVVGTMVSVYLIRRRRRPSAVAASAAPAAPSATTSATPSAPPPAVHRGSASPS